MQIYVQYLLCADLRTWKSDVLSFASRIFNETDVKLKDRSQAHTI